MSFFLGADGGQTHSQAVLVNETGEILGVGHGGPSNHYNEPGGKLRFRSALKDITTGAFAAAGVPISSGAAAACFGLTGSWMRAEAVVRKFLKTEHFLAVEDTITAHAGALAGKPGIVIIAGTGAVAYGRNEVGLTAQSGGLGYLLSDEGAGFDIGQRALRAAIQAADGRGPRTTLGGLLLDHFRLPDFTEVAQVLYNHKEVRVAIAHLSPIVVQAAAAGDPVAAHILEYAAGELGRCILAVARQLDWPNPTVSTTGGVFRAGKLILDPLGAYLARHLPGALVVPAAYPPVIGAALLALESGGIPVDREHLDNLNRGLSLLTPSS